MPIYTYECTSCGVRFEKTQKFSDDPLTICPECNTTTLRKVYTPVGIVFKGSGFYSTDHRSSSGTDRARSHASESKSSGEKETKTEKSKDSTSSSDSSSKASSTDSSSSD